MRNKSIGAIILAGGYSTRMNRPKAFLLFDDSKDFITRVINEYNIAGINDIVVVMNTTEYLNEWLYRMKALSSVAKFIINPAPSMGRLHSIRIGIKALHDVSQCFIQDVDRPFVDRKILSTLKNEKMTGDYLVPGFQGKSGHPVLAGKEVMYGIGRTVDPGLTLRDILRPYKKQIVEVFNSNVLVNINTPDDYQIHFGAKPKVLIR